MVENIHKMGLHDVIYITKLSSVMRVPGGWIYRIKSECDITSCFVPYDNTFEF